MSAKIAGIVIGLAAAGLLAAAHASAFAKPPAGKKSQAAKPAASATVKHPAAASRRNGKASASGPSVAELVSTNAARPQAERLAIESDLVAGKGAGGAVGWRLIDDPATGARLAVPEKLVPRSGAARIGSRWTSAQGQIQIETFRLAEAALPVLFEDEKKAAHREVESSALTPNAFTISGVQGLKNFVVRVEAGAAGSSELRGVTILYDQATAGIMGPVAVAVASAFTGFPDPNWVPLPGMRPGVEYSTAIVVSARGDLLASAQATEACQAIAVPGRGHAERIAADKTSDLALIRLYGARKLVPATLAGAVGAVGAGDAGNASGELTLVGIADPAVETGAGAVTRLASRLTAQGIEPAPKPGFSGAAALDAQGRFAGMVDLKPPLPTAGGTAASTLVPADVIRGFLRAQGIAANGTAVDAAATAAAAGDPAIEQSMLRVICVRK